MDETMQVEYLVTDSPVGPLTLGGFAPGVELKRILLRHEGVGWG